jgi:CTP synthase
VHERHRHRFEFNNEFRPALEKEGLIASGLSADGKLVEVVELQNHPWMVATQFHPEFKSRPNRPHPLFCEFVRAAMRTVREGGQHPLPLRQSMKGVS